MRKPFPFHCSFSGVASSPAPWEGRPGDHPSIFERGNHCQGAKPDIFQLTPENLGPADTPGCALGSCLAQLIPASLFPGVNPAAALLLPCLATLPGSRALGHPHEVFQVFFGAQGQRGVWSPLSSTGCFFRNREKKAFLELNNGRGAGQEVFYGHCCWKLWSQGFFPA